MLEFAKGLALRAGGMLRRGLSGPMSVRLKGPADIVTEMDTASERLILDALRARFPDHAILAEESGASPGGEYRWLIDPLDGTVNYSHRWPHWAVSLALEHRGQLILGVVYAPVCGELYWAERGKGAFRDGERLRVSDVARFEQALLNAGSLSLRPDVPPADQPLGRLLRAAFKVRQTGVCSLDLCWLAAGRVDACVQGKTTPWDVGAGMLLVAEAGGRITRLDGSPFGPEYGPFLASNGVLHEEMCRVLS